MAGLRKTSRATNRDGSALPAWLLPVVTLCLMFACFLLATILFPPRSGPPANISIESILKDQLLLAELQGTLADRLDLLAGLNASFERTSLLLGVSTLLGIYLLRTRRGEFEMPIVKFTVPLLWVQLALPGIMTYWFLQWGHLLHRVIDTRAVCWLTIRAMEQKNAPSIWASPGLYVMSRSQFLRDTFFVDSWFLANHPEMHGMPEGRAAPINRIILAGLGIFIAATHAMSLALLADAGNHHFSRSAPRFMLGIYSVVCAGLVMFAHFIFVYIGPHPNWLTYVILAMAPALAMLFVKIGRAPEAEPSIRPAPGTGRK